jgi:hypothetical protein
MMFRKRYPLEPHGRKRLEISRNVDWTEIIILLDGVELSRTDAEGIAKGHEIRLWDQSLLRVWLERGPRDTPFLYLTRNGHPLTGSAGDPEKILRETLSIIWVVAAVQICLPLMVITGTADRADPVFNWMLALGCVLALLSIFAWRRSVAAMIAACALLFAEVVVVMVTQAKLNFGNVWSLLFAFGLLGWMLMRGIKAVRALKAVALPIRHPPEPMRHSHPS